MKKADNKQRLRTFLLSGAKKPGDLQRALSVSQPTFSRLIRNLKSEITVLGAGRPPFTPGKEP